MSSAATAPLRSVSQLLGLAPAPAAHPVDVVRPSLPPRAPILILSRTACDRAQVQPRRPGRSVALPRAVSRCSDAVPPRLPSLCSCRQTLQHGDPEPLPRRAEPPAGAGEDRRSLLSVLRPLLEYSLILRRADLERATDFVELNEQVEVSLDPRAFARSPDRSSRPALRSSTTCRPSSQHSKRTSRPSRATSLSSKVAARLSRVVSPVDGYAVSSREFGRALTDFCPRMSSDLCIRSSFRSESRPR